MKTGGGKTRPYVKTRAARGKRRAHNAHPYAKTEGVPVGRLPAARKAFPTGEGVTAYAVTDEGFSTPVPVPEGFCPAGRNPFGHPSDENGRACPALRKDQGRSWKTAGAQSAPAGLTGRPYSARAGAIPSWGMPANSTHPRRQHKRGMGVVHYPRRTRAPCQGPRLPYRGPGKADCGTQAERMWSRGPAGSVTRRRFACFAAGGKVGARRAESPRQIL